MARYFLCTAFSLVELSIVLVILGLLVGGVLSGRALIHASELRSVQTDVASFDTAVNAFKSKYFQPPGDMNNATSFWPANCLDDVPNSLPCNGNGDGVVTNLNGKMEPLRFWQHLALAGLIPGNYNAINTRVIDYYSVAKSKDFSPPSRITNAFYVPDTDLVGGYSLLYPARNVNGKSYVMTFGFVTDTNVYTGAVLRPEDAYNLDVKMDDGLPLVGALQGNDGQTIDSQPISPSCVNVTAYRTDSSTIACSLIYVR